MFSGGVWDYIIYLWTDDIYISPVNPDNVWIGVNGIGYSGGEGLYKSTDGGESWKQKNFGAGGALVSTIAVDPTNNNTMYYGTIRWARVYRSGDGGDNWEVISPGTGGYPEFVSNVWDLAVDNGGQVFASTSSGLYKWEGDKNWSRVQGLPDTNTTDLVFDNHPASSVFYVGTSGNGVFVSYDGGSSWESFNNGLSKLSISKLKINDSYPLKLYAGTTNGGVWVTTLIEEGPNYIPKYHKPNASIDIFPNPSNGSFNVINKGNADLYGSFTIVNLLGEIIYKVDNVKLVAKKPNKLHLKNISAGSYILVFKSNNFTIRKKFIISD